mmetsp:Transcript_28729/g.80997  ORF Transcript_28729/g.80997 Transcript_28729/m.80997 type:complete len:112 (+) Transcript_28729:264-599(+)
MNVRHHDAHEARHAQQLFPSNVSCRTKQNQLTQSPLRHSLDSQTSRQGIRSSSSSTRQRSWLPAATPVSSRAERSLEFPSSRCNTNNSRCIQSSQPVSYISISGVTNTHLS